jgi:uncharacterized phage infection (PIP) family protein YhgE
LQSLRSEINEIEQEKSQIDVYQSQIDLLHEQMSRLSDKQQSCQGQLNQAAQAEIKGLIKAGVLPKIQKTMTCFLILVDSYDTETLERYSNFEYVLAACKRIMLAQNLQKVLASYRADMINELKLSECLVLLAQKEK